MIIVFLFLILIIYSSIHIYFFDDIGSMCNKNNCLGIAGLIEGVNGNAMKFNNSFYIAIINYSLDVLGSDDFKIDLWIKTSQNTIGDIISKGYSNSTWFSVTQRNIYV